MSTCRACAAEIEWAVTENGRKIPLDLDVANLGAANLAVVSRQATEYGMAPVVAYVPPGSGTRVSHFATCPEADTFRRDR